MNILGKYRTFGQRLLAGLIDGLIFIPFSLLDNYFHDVENNIVFISWQFISMITLTLYLVIGHGKYGQTLGKKVMDIKVLDLDEINLIGYKRAFLRESIWVLANTSWIIYYIYESSYHVGNYQEIRIKIIESYGSMTILFWFLLELMTMMLNNKRRALHDYIAGSVVVKLSEVKRENLQKRHQELISSIQSQ